MLFLPSPLVKKGLAKGVAGGSKGVKGWESAHVNSLCRP